MFSLPCRVIICRSPPCSRSGNINRQKTQRQRGKTNRQSTASLLFSPLSFHRPNLRGRSSRTQPLGEQKRANSGAHEHREAVWPHVRISIRNTGDLVSHRLACHRLFPEWCLHRLLAPSREYIWKETLQTLVCTDTKRGIRDTQVDTERRRERREGTDFGGSDTLRSTRAGSLRIVKLLLNFSQKPADCKSFTLWLPSFLCFVFLQLPPLRYCVPKISTEKTSRFCTVIYTLLICTCVPIISRSLPPFFFLFSVNSGTFLSLSKAA